jgi:Tol biopolymer transport system component
MTLPPDLQRRLRAFLDDEMSPRAPDHVVSDVLAAVGRTRRRPAWRIPERWIPMTTTMRLAVVPRALILLLLLALVVATLAAGGLVVGSLMRAAKSLPPPYGPARNGLIAFDAGGDIWVVEPDGSGRRQLTTGPALDNAPAWSRDGTRIAYWSQEVEGGPSSLIVSDADGSHPMTIARDEAGRMSLQFLDWSPDGRHIAYSLGATLDPIAFDEHVFVAATDGSGARQTGDPDLIARMPTWSPDGTLLAFQGSASAGAILDTYYPEHGVYLMAPDGTAVRRVSMVESPDPYEFYRTEWSPDGARLASNVGGQIWGFDTDGSGESAIAPSYDNAALVPRWSPDGQTILYMSLNTGHLYTTPAAGGDPTDLGDSTGDPTWSPDGTQIAGFGGDQRLVTIDALTGKVITDVETGDQSYPPGTYQYPSWQRLAQ